MKNKLFLPLVLILCAVLVIISFVVLFKLNTKSNSNLSRTDKKDFISNDVSTKDEQSTAVDDVESIPYVEWADYLEERGIHENQSESTGELNNIDTDITFPEHAVVVRLDIVQDDAALQVQPVLEEIAYQLHSNGWSDNAIKTLQNYAVDNDWNNVVIDYSRNYKVDYNWGWVEKILVNDTEYVVIESDYVYVLNPDLF